MIKSIKNSKNKKVAEVDMSTQTIVIKQRDCKTTIHFAEDGTLKVENTIQNISTITA